MINRNLIDKMLEMPDEKFLMMMKVVLSNSGLAQGRSSPKIDEKTLRRIRCVLAELTDDDLDRIATLTDVYKKGV